MANEVKIREMAKRLNLYNIARLETYDTYLSATDYIEYLLKYEIDERNKRSLENNRKISHLPKVGELKELNGITK